MVSAQECAAAARELRSNRAGIAAQLSALVAGWPKYAAEYAADPEAFAEVESGALVDYAAGFLETGDENYRHLYTGEKAKQFHDPDVPQDERHARELALLAGERGIFSAALAAHPGARAALDAHFAVITDVLTADAAVTADVLFVGDCLYLDVMAFLVAPALADGIRIEPSFVTSHDASTVCAALAKLADKRFDVVFYSPFTYAFAGGLDALGRPRTALKPAEARKQGETAVSSAELIFDTVADLFDCPIFTHLPTPMLRNEGTMRDRIAALLTAGSRHAATRRVRESLTQRSAERKARGQTIRLIDEEALIAGIGGWQAGRYLYRSARQHPARFGAIVAEQYREILFVIAHLFKRKLIVCDLDNTLWEGVIGEGLGVKHHRDRQATLVKLKDRGVVLAINSKNDPAKAVWEPLEGCVGLEDFVSRQINWDPKPLNMQRIADHLNLKPKDFVFIDDRADEREMVREAFPKTLALDALDRRSWDLIALWADLIEAKAGGDRTEFYRQRDARQSFIAADAEASAEQRAEMYKGLGLSLVIREAEAADVARVTDLINRTNQFNMAGSRVSKRQVEDWVGGDTARVLIADAADRFGTMGTIAVLVAQREGGRLTIPTYVLSCRVFGYGMEFAILEEARKLALPGESLFGLFRETEHNQPCREVYPQAGFHAVPDGWQLDAADGAPIKQVAWLQVRAQVSAFDTAKSEAEQCV